MRQDFRVKMDISRIYQDARQYSWVFIDSTKILYVNQLAEHVEKLFDISKPFHLLSRYEDTHYFLPFEEDVRILENNDTVVVVPSTGIEGTYETKSDKKCSFQMQNGFAQPHNYNKLENTRCSEKFSNISQKSSVQNNNTSASDNLSLSSTLYRTAFHDTMEDGESKDIMDESKDSRMNEDNYTEDTSITDENRNSSKRKRIRKRKQKQAEKANEMVADSDVSLVESSGKKPKIIDSILISSGKHIRFKGLDDEDSASRRNSLNENNIQQPNGLANEHVANKNLSTLLALRQSSTPLTFTHKKIKREQYNPEKVDEIAMSLETTEVSQKTNENLSLSKSATELEKTKDNSRLANKSNADDSTVSFRVFKLGEDYTPQLSDVIIAKVLSCSPEGSYSMKILHGKEHLQEPEGKFSLPKDEEENNLANDIITLDKSRLYEFRKVKAIEILP